MHLLSRGLDKLTYQSTTVVLFWWINLAKVGPYWAVGLFDDGQLYAAAWLAPLAVAGMLLGVWMHSRVSDRHYFRIIRTLLLVTGAKLIWDGTTGLLG